MNFSMLLTYNNRSKAYLQNLVKSGFLPEKIILLIDNDKILPEQTENDLLINNSSQKFIRAINELNISFDEKEDLLTTIRKNKIEYVIVKTLKVNSKEVISKIEAIESKYIVYSGPGGAILGKEILSLDKLFIHVHPGWLPKYRGSTTIYYSIISENSISASVLILNEGIDEGEILYREKFQVKEKGIDLDYVLDPLIRTKALLSFMQSRKIEPIEQNETVEANTFYIIHPFLKHLAIIKNEQN